MPLLSQELKMGVGGLQGLGGGLVNLLDSEVRDIALPARLRSDVCV